jgi:hypothetical protein
MGMQGRRNIELPTGPNKLLSGYFAQPKLLGYNEY